MQLTTDGLKVYLGAVETAFGRDIDYAQLVKIYGAEPTGEKRYSPAKCLGTERFAVQDRPNSRLASTSYVERQNLNIRMANRRFTRLTDVFSKKLEQHCASLALYFFFFNFVRPHLSLRTDRNNRITPAMATGAESKPWTIEGMLGLLPEVEHRGRNSAPRQEPSI
ncbi:MAG: hypothetical protein K8F56_09280 [Rhodocyclaceae bacterium]|nr:hypothetical protein [Rhodocyclaceae bacterium]